MASLTAEDTEKSSMNANIIRETAREPVNFAAPETDIPFLTAADTGTGISFSSEGAGSDGSKATEECPAISLTKPKFSAASEVGFSSGISGSNAICPLPYQRKGTEFQATPPFRKRYSLCLRERV